MKGDEYMMTDSKVDVAALVEGLNFAQKVERARQLIRQADREFSLDISRAVSYKFYCRAVGFGSEIYPETYGLSGKKWVSLSAKS